ncbi:MAG: SDR family NAD(P)-dependent oxidoreductase [Chloroflexi bacterium]|nr:SDR family NAD(P)-dependent oxidoreductase [Chloroflexota bacterium]
MTGMESNVVLVTGATSGIGKATAMAVAQAGGTVVLVARNKSKGAATLAEIQKATGNNKIDLLQADLSSLDSVRLAAQEFKRRYSRLDALINNAAVIVDKRILTADGLEMIFATNHLGPFLLTNLLLETLVRSAPARVVNVTAPSTTKIDFDDLQGARKYNAIMAFGASKAANLLFTFALARRLQNRGVTANAYHPGIVRTNLMGQAPVPMRYISVLMNLFGRTPERAADGLVQLVSSSRFDGVTGKFVHDGKFLDTPLAQDMAAQERLWQVSEKLAGLNS